MTIFDITDPINESLGVGVQSEGVTTADDHTGRYDFMIGGQPWLAATNERDTLQRALEASEKQQLDTGSAAGEQSLAGWWMRSQFDFSGGSGQPMFEPAQDDGVRTRFASSQGVDVWSGDGFRLLPETADCGLSNVSSVASCTVSNTDYVVASDGTTTQVVEPGEAPTTVTGLPAQPSWLWSTGSRIIACHATGVALINPSTATASALWTGAPSAPKAWWVKQRIIAAVGPKLFELGLAGGAWPGTALYEHPDSGWVWSGVVETPAMILASGYSGSKSAIYKFVLDGNGELPSLTSAITVAEFPQGEIVTGMFSYLGSFLVVGTNKGVRVGTVQDERVQYGPLSFKTDQPVEHFSGRDSYVWCGVSAGLPDGSSGLVRIDLGGMDETGRCPWATDLACPDTGTVKGVTHRGLSGDLVFAAGDVYESGSDPVAAGWLQTSQVLYGTLEDKALASVKITGELGSGTCVVSRVDRRGNASSMYTLSGGVATEMELRAFVTDKVAFRFDLAAGSNGDNPLLSGWQLKALPAVARHEAIRIPLLCYDNETDRDGLSWARPAHERWLALRDRVTSAPVVAFKDLATGEVRRCQVQQCVFEQRSAPTGAEGFGGIVTLTLRVLT